MVIKRQPFLALMLCTTLASFGLTAQSSAPPPTIAPNAAQTMTLGNGLKVVVVEDHAASVVQTSVYYHFGSLQETDRKSVV